MSTSITAMAGSRLGPAQLAGGRTGASVMIEVTPTGRAALERVGRCAEVHLAEVLTPLDPPSRRRLHGGLGVLRKVFATSAGSASRRTAAEPEMTSGVYFLMCETEA